MACGRTGSAFRFRHVHGLPDTPWGRLRGYDVAMSPLNDEIYLFFFFELGEEIQNLSELISSYGLRAKLLRVTETSDSAGWGNRQGPLPPTVESSLNTFAR